MDRYQALGIPYPDPETVCPGDCEGTKIVPVRADDENPVYRQRWLAAEKAEPTDDGWHFVKCADCDGSGKAAKAKGAAA
jgi:hypothetical protein